MSGSGDSDSDRFARDVEDEAQAALRAADAAVDSLLAINVDALGDKAMVRFVRGVERVAARLGGLRLRVVRAFDNSGVWATESAAYSASVWLRNETGTSGGDARRQVRLAGVLRFMPLADEALAAGEITVRALQVLARCVGPRTRDLYAQHEPMLVDQAKKLDADQLDKAVNAWLELADQDGPEPGDDPRRDSVHLTRLGTGRWVLRGDLCDEVGTEMAALLTEMCDQLFRRDRAIREVDPTDPLADRPPSNRRAEALYEFVRQGAAAPGNPNRRKPAFSVLTDLQTLAGEGDTAADSDAVHETLDGSIIPIRLLRLWSCDAHFCRIVLGADGEPIDLGRLERHPTPGQRRVLEARDRGCAVPGCDRRPSWCDAHHIIEWGPPHNGPTDIDNLVLLCRHHHRRIHRNTLRVTMIERRPRFFLPDGRHLQEGRDPPCKRLAS